MKFFASSLFILFCVLFLTSCEYKAPLVKENKIPVEKALLGNWEFINEKNNEEKVSLLFLKFSETEYLLHYVEKESDTYFRCYPIKIGNINCLQLQIISYKNEPVSETEKKLYLVYSYKITNDVLEVSGLNEKLVSDQLEDTKSLKKAFLKEKDNKELFTDPGKFKRIPKKE